MQQYAFRGESEQELARRLAGRPKGTIVVAKDYDTSWIAKRSSFMGSQVKFAPCAARFVKSFFED